MDECDRKLRCGMSKKSGNKHGWYAAAKGQVLCQVGGTREYSGARTVYENIIKSSNRHRYLSCGHICCRLLVKVSVVGRGMLFDFLAKSVSVYAKIRIYGIFMYVYEYTSTGEACI
jgi:hypothetical protein